VVPRLFAAGAKPVVAGNKVMPPASANPRRTHGWFMMDKPTYSERISSNRTEALFLALTILFLLLFLWRSAAAGADVLAAVFLILSIVFLFYSINYRTLIIRFGAKSLKLTFGVFSWEVPFANIEACALDELPASARLGGAGIHFMSVRKRYRASFNFLEYPRAVIALKKPAGPVRDLSFSTRRPEAVLRLLREAASANRTAP
jgi:hypothetical protein